MKLQITRKYLGNDVKKGLVKVGRKTLYKLNLTQRYFRLVLWLFVVSDIAPYLVLASRIDELRDRNGYKFVTQYLKESVRLVQHGVSGNPSQSIPGEIRVASRRGLPLIIPGSLRLQMEARKPEVIRIILTLLSIFRIYKFPGVLKLGTITDSFTGISEVVLDKEARMVFGRFRDTWSRPLGVIRTDLTTILPLKTAGPNHKISILGAPLDAVAWLRAPEVLRDSFRTLANAFNPELLQMGQDEMKCVEQFTPTKDPILGKLSLKNEPAGKIRVFAIVDVGTQSVLKPLHDEIYRILRSIPQDGTFDQGGPISLLLSKIDENTKCFSYDLSAATDRLPILLQVQVMSLFFSRRIADAGRELLVGRSYRLKDEHYRYSVGQPMGALSSFGMLALTHHFIVQLAAMRVGHQGGFDRYALLGDDIVIADENVALAYHYIMVEHLGVKINDFKTLKSDRGVMEFAKRLVSPKEEGTPLGPKNILGCLRHPGNIPSLFLDLIGKGGARLVTEQEVNANMRLLSHDVVRVSKGGKEALIGSIIGPFGFVNSSGVAPLPETTSLESTESFRLVKSIERTVKEQYSREWDSAFDKSIKAVLGLWAKREYPLFTELPSPHTFPSYRSLTLRALEVQSNLLDKRPLVEDTYFDGNQPGHIYFTTGMVKEILDSVPKVSPLDNPWMVPEKAKPSIRRIGIDFFREVLQWTYKLKEEEIIVDSIARDSGTNYGPEW